MVWTLRAWQRWHKLQGDSCWNSGLELQSLQIVCANSENELLRGGAQASVEFTRSSGYGAFCGHFAHSEPPGRRGRCARYLQQNIVI